MYYDVVIMGATSVALGIAEELKQKQSVLIIDSTQMVAAEYINAYKPGRNWDKEPVSELGKAIAEKLRAQRVITKEGAHFYAAGPVFYQAYRRLGVALLLDTEIIKVETAADYKISIYNCAGYDTVETKLLLETRDPDSLIAHKSLNCVLTGKTDFPALSVQGLDFYPEQDGQFKTVIMKYHCSLDASLSEARHDLVETWQGRPRELRDWKIAAIGLRFDVTLRTGRPEVKRLYPASAYDNPLAAVDAGSEVGRRLADAL